MGCKRRADYEPANRLCEAHASFCVSAGQPSWDCRSLQEQWQCLQRSWTEFEVHLQPLDVDSSAESKGGSAFVCQKLRYEVSIVHVFLDSIRHREAHLTSTAHCDVDYMDLAGQVCPARKASSEPIVKARMSTYVTNCRQYCCQWTLLLCEVVVFCSMLVRSRCLCEWNSSHKRRGWRRAASTP